LLLSRLKRKKKCSNKNDSREDIYTFESQKLNYFEKKSGAGVTLVSLDPCQWSLMSLITGNKVKKHTSQGIVKKKRTKPTKEF
jgi:hypothetical protein